VTEVPLTTILITGGIVFFTDSWSVERILVFTSFQKKKVPGIAKKLKEARKFYDPLFGDLCACRLSCDGPAYRIRSEWQLVADCVKRTGGG